MIRKILFLGLLLGTVNIAFATNSALQVFTRSDFSGQHLQILRDWSAGPQDYWNNRINSLIVPPGYEAHLFSGRGYSGEYAIVQGQWSCADNSYWCNRISSIRILPTEHYPVDPPPPPPNHRPYAPPVVTIFEHNDFNGAALDISGEWSVRQACDFWNDRISSIYVPPGYGVVIYEHSYFRGASTMITHSWSARRARDFWNDRISSLRVVRL